MYEAEPTANRFRKSRNSLSGILPLIVLQALLQQRALRLRRVGSPRQNGVKRKPCPGGHRDMAELLEEKHSCRAEVSDRIVVRVATISLILTDTCSLF